MLEASDRPGGHVRMIHDPLPITSMPTWAPNISIWCVLSAASFTPSKIFTAMAISRNWDSISAKSIS